MAKFPALPSTVDRYVREFLNRLAGRTGNAGDKAVLHSELAELGLAREKGQRLSLPATAVKSITDTLEPALPELPEVEQPDTPTPASGLATTGIFGGVVLDWDAPAYTGHAHTEVWRAQVDDRAQATLVHQSPLSSYTDITGGTTVHYYWVRQVNSAGQVGGFNALDGTPGQGTAIISLEDLLLESPEILEQPFTVRNIGTEEEPQYVLIFNGYLAVNGPINISLLESGELANGTALTVGQGSIELSTGSDGFGQMIITGTGGVATNDYLILKEGRIESFVYTEAAGHVRYKEVRRVESGTASNGQQVVIPPYFKSQPLVSIYPRDTSVYNASYPDQSQRLELAVGDVVAHPTIEGAWTFTPVCRLVLSDGGRSEAHGLFYSGANDSQRWELPARDNVQGITVFCRAGSSRHTGSGNTYQNRQVSMTLYYRTVGGDWLNGGSTTTSINRFDTHTLQVNKSLGKNTYEFAVQFTADDRTGTFTSGELEYDYTQANRSGTPWTLTNSPTQYASTKREYIYIDETLTGWEVTRIDYSVTADITLNVRNLFTDKSSFGKVFQGVARVRLPDGLGGLTTYEKTTTQGDTVEIGNPWEEYQFSNVSFQFTDTNYKNGVIYPAVEVYGNKAGYSSKKTSASYIPSSYASVHIKTVSATVYYRKAKPVSATPANTFYWDSSYFNLGATDISLTDAVVHWTASGE